MHLPESRVADTATTTARIHAFDHLRALAMLAGVFFHAALAHSPMSHGFWPTAHRAQAPIIDALAWFLHLIRMPVFFVVAGYFTVWLIVARGWSGLLRQRLRRIVLPFLFAFPLIHGVELASIEWAAKTVAHPSPLLSMVREAMQMPNPPTLPPTTGHLWFLYYLLIFTAFAWIAHALELAPKLSRWPGLTPGRVLGFLPLFVAIGFLATTTPHPAPDSLFPQFFGIALYGPFFALGAYLHGRLYAFSALRRLALPMLIVSALLYLAYLVRIEGFSAADWFRTAPPDLALIQALIATLGTTAILMFGLHGLNRPNRFLAYLARSSYWTYLLHLPVLFAVQFWLIDLDLHWASAFLAATGITFAVCLISYELLVRRTRLREWVG